MWVLKFLKFLNFWDFEILRFRDFGTTPFFPHERLWLLNIKDRLIAEGLVICWSTSLALKRACVCQCVTPHGKYITWSRCCCDDDGDVRPVISTAPAPARLSERVIVGSYSCLLLCPIPDLWKGASSGEVNPFFLSWTGCSAARPM